MKKDNRRRNLFLYGVAGLILLVVFLLLFAKDWKKKNQIEEDYALQGEVPTATITDLESDKVSIYKEEKDVIIQSEEELAEETLREEEKALSAALNSANSPVPSSSSNYISEEEWRQQYEQELYISELEQDKLQMEQELKQLKEMQEQEDKQMAMMEKVYELSNRPAQKELERQEQERLNALVAKEYQESLKYKSDDTNLETTSIIEPDDNVVSLLSHTYTEEEFGEKMENEELKTFFVTAVEPSRFTHVRNAIKATVDETQVIKPGQTLEMRLQEEIQLANSVRIPRGAKLIAKTSLSGNRMNLSVDAIEHEGQIIGVKFAVYDLDGQRGVYVPWSLEGESIKEFGKGVSSTLGSPTISMDRQSAKEKLKSDLGRGILRGSAQYINAKMDIIRVRFKAGYQLYLMDISSKH